MQAVDIIVLVLVVLLLGFALKGTLKHFKGEGACCGGSHESITEKKLNKPVIGQYEVKIDGMHCQNCVDRVTNSINKIDGARANVSLRKQKAIVEFDRNVSEESITKAIEDAGYKVERFINE